MGNDDLGSWEGGEMVEIEWINKESEEVGRYNEL